MDNSAISLFRGIISSFDLSLISQFPLWGLAEFHVAVFPDWTMSHIIRLNSIASYLIAQTHPLSATGRKTKTHDDPASFVHSHWLAISLQTAGRFMDLWRISLPFLLRQLAVICLHAKNFRKCRTLFPTVRLHLAATYRHFFYNYPIKRW